MRLPRVPWRHLFGQIIYGAIFLLLAGFIIIGANGYRWDISHLSVEQTGLISLTVKPERVIASIDGKTKPYRSPIKFAYLLPGYHTVEVHKAGYLPWTKNIHVDPGEAVVEPFVTLFLANGLVQPASVENMALLQRHAADTVDSDMDIRSNEIWIKPLSRTYPFQVVSDRFALVSRFALPLEHAMFMPGKKHVLFQTDGEIRLMGRDGSNDIVLVTLQKSEPTDFTVTNDGRWLVYRDGNTIWQKQIQ